MPTFRAAGNRKRPGITRHTFYTASGKLHRKSALFNFSSALYQTLQDDLNNPPILILDEATSSVDTRTEVLIQEAMAEMMKGRTLFVIANRISTIKDSDNILYMQDGDILEVGNHQTLMEKKRTLCKAV